MNESVTSWLKRNNLPSSLSDELAELGIYNVSDFSNINSTMFSVTMDQYILKLPSFKEAEILKIKFQAAIFDTLKTLSSISSFEPLQNQSYNQYVYFSIIICFVYDMI